jgi:predicted MPP superfamily phosphohydrolase
VKRNNNRFAAVTTINRRQFLKVGGAVLGGSVAIATGYLYANDQTEQLVIERVQLPIKNLKPALEGLRIVQLGDLHLYPFTDIGQIRQAIETANALEPDLIVLMGDYVTRQAEAVFELVPLLSTLNAKYGVFTIIGNHDIWTDVEVVQSGLTKARLPILKNDGLMLAVGRERLYLAGVDDGWSGQPDLAAALANLPGDVTTILLAHEPDLADQFSQDGRISLQLSGHTHGGQIRLPGIGAVILPYLGLKYDLGLYQINGMWLYTNRGIGNVAEPVRLNCSPEVTEITLVTA